MTNKLPTTNRITPALSAMSGFVMLSERGTIAPIGINSEIKAAIANLVQSFNPPNNEKETIPSGILCKTAPIAKIGDIGPKTVLMITPSAKL